MFLESAQDYLWHRVNVDPPEDPRDIEADLMAIKAVAEFRGIPWEECPSLYDIHPSGPALAERLWGSEQAENSPQDQRGEA